VKKVYPVSPVLIVFVALIVFLSACRKINDYTEVGGGLIPPVDNINTFDTTIAVQIYNDTFSLASDSETITTADEHFLGLINNDPIFGKTDARIFFELKTPYYGLYPFARKDSVVFDSLVLVLSYVETYGDSTIPQLFKVYEIAGPEFDYDSTYLVRKENFSYNTANPLNEIPYRFITPSTLNDSIRVFRDTSANQVRIRLDTNLARRLLNYDTTTGYKNDSIFKSLFKGFAVRSESGGNAVIGLNMRSTDTKLAFYYRAPKPGGSGTIDTAVSYLYFTSNSRSANYVKRDYSGTPVAAAAGLPVEAPVGYIQKTPGTFAMVKIPALPGLSNRVVHRAELIVEQVFDPSDRLFPPPDRMYLDAYDPTITTSYKFRTVPWSLDISPIGGFDFTSFGSSPKTEKDPFGNDIKVWHFNLSRYVQHVLTGTQTSYDLRLYAPLTIRGKARLTGSTVDFDIPPNTYVNGSIVTGRIRVGGGNHPTQKMRLRIIYSKL
jgi:hypothetical protein